MAFEIFRETGTRTKEFISVTEKKTFGLSRAFLDKHGVTKEHKAVIFFDPEENKIALHFSTNNPKFGFSVRISNEKHGAIIVARSFFDVKDIDSKRYAGRYSDFEAVPLSKIGQFQTGEAFVFKLKESKATVPSSSDDSDETPIDLSEIPF